MNAICRFFVSLLVLATTRVSSLNSQSAMKLPLGDINVLVLTDVHSWINGHPHEQELDATYAHVLSLYERIEEIVASDDEGSSKDLFFVMNGDFMDGTGFSTYPPHALVPILERMPWDAVNVGNHELYKNETLQYITQTGGFVDWWNGGYLTSNVLLSSTGVEMGARYKVLEGSHSSVLCFGFLYNMKNNSPFTKVVPVEDVVQEDWFKNALQGGHDAILVLAHMDVKDPLVYVILNAIRAVLGPTMPVQFIAGHTHNRDFQKLDNYSTSFEAGRYLDTVGFTSFPKAANVAQATNPASLFQHRFINGSQSAFKELLNISFLPTSNGIEMEKMIDRTAQSMGLLDIVGCSTKHYKVFAPLTDSLSLHRLYLEEIIPDFFIKGNYSKVFIHDTGSLRYDLFEGNVTETDIVSVSPFRDVIYKVAAQVPGRILLDMIQALQEQSANNATQKLPWPNVLKPYGVAGKVVPADNYDLYTPESTFNTMVAALKAQNWNDTVPMQQQHSSSHNPVITTQLWFEYVSRKMKCAGGRYSAIQNFGKTNTGKAGFGIFLFVLVLLIAIVATIIYRRKVTRNYFDRHIVAEDVAEEHPQFTID